MHKQSPNIDKFSSKFIEDCKLEGFVGFTNDKRYSEAE